MNILDGFVLTVYEPRWHGFAKWQLEWRQRHGQTPLVTSTPIRSGFVRRRGFSVGERQVTPPLTRRVCRRIAASL